MTSPAPALRGLSEAEASRRLAVVGPNELPRGDQRGLLRIVADVLRQPMFALLAAGGAIYTALGDPREAAVLALFAGASVAIAVIQDWRSERVLAALNALASPRAMVIRDGERRRLPGRELVPGDLIAVAEGERIPADALLRTGDAIESDESLLTGESAPVAKRSSQAQATLDAPGSADGPSLFSGALVVRGQGVAEVVATGLRSQLGRLGRSVQSLRERPARLEAETRRLVTIAGLIAAAVCAAVVLALGVARGDWLQAALAGVALGMALLPEEFPLVLTVFTVMGARRLSRSNVLTRHAAAIEALGEADVLCVDKTGTLTVNHMTLAAAWDGRETTVWSGASTPLAARPLARICRLASAQHPFDPMERAFHEACAGWFEPPSGWRLEAVRGLSPDLMAVTQVWRGPDGRGLVAAKGAPEAIARLCGLSADESRSAMATVHDMAADGMRVLGVAEAPLEGDWRPDAPLTFDGLVGLVDPLRDDAAASVAACRAAGVRVVMITGDHLATARAIAAQAGIPTEDVATGDEVEALPDLDLAERVRRSAVYARIRPEQKLRIVQALQRAGAVVAMTGDGVNDAPALKAADIGVAMGRRGSDVARAAADLILLDDRLASIVDGVRLGRRIFDNLRKAMGFIVAVHVPIAGVALLPVLLGGDPLLLPAHIAMLELIIDPVCSIVFEAERDEADVMKRPPRDRAAGMVTRRRLLEGVAQGGLALAAVLALYFLAPAIGLADDRRRATTFLCLVLCVFGLVLANRSLSSAAAGFLRPSAPLAVVALVVGGLLAATTGAPALGELFRFASPGWDGFTLALAAAGANASALILLRRVARPRSV